FCFLEDKKQKKKSIVEQPEVESDLRTLHVITGVKSVSGNLFLWNYASNRTFQAGSLVENGWLHHCTVEVVA
ncbi:hypothetical protein, partial [Vibrio lentus]|uniref:hypothetical protein n=1 Tax=Vibrio lentus TaxID=136468 RepID=UPI0035E9DEC7